MSCICVAVEGEVRGDKVGAVLLPHPQGGREVVGVGRNIGQQIVAGGAAMNPLVVFVASVGSTCKISIEFIHLKVGISSINFSFWHFNPSQ